MLPYSTLQQFLSGKEGTERESWLLTSWISTKGGEAPATLRTAVRSVKVHSWRSLEVLKVCFCFHDFQHHFIADIDKDDLVRCHCWRPAQVFATHLLPSPTIFTCWGSPAVCQPRLSWYRCPQTGCCAETWHTSRSRWNSLTVIHLVNDC